MYNIHVSRNFPSRYTSYNLREKFLFKVIFLKQFFFNYTANPFKARIYSLLVGLNPDYPVAPGFLFTMIYHFKSIQAGIYLLLTKKKTKVSNFIQLLFNFKLYFLRNMHNLCTLSLYLFFMFIFILGSEKPWLFDFLLS